MLAAGEPSRGVHHGLAQRPVRGVVLAEPVLLREPFDVDRDRHQIVSANRGSDERKTASPTTKSTRRDGDADGDLAQLGRGGVEDRPAPAGDHGRHRIEREDPLPLHRDLGHREHHAREQRQDLEEHGDHVADVAVADVDSREQQADPEHGHDREQHEQRRRDDLPAGGPGVVLPHQDEQHGKADDEVHERHGDPAEREQSPGEVHLRDEREVRQQAQARQAESRREVLHRQHTGDDEARIRRRARREVRELPEDDHVDQGRERRNEDRPRDAEERLLVAHGDVAPDERPEELAVVPELGDVEARDPARGPDDGHPRRIDLGRAVWDRREPGVCPGVRGSRRRSLLFERRVGSNHPGMVVDASAGAAECLPALRRFPSRRPQSPRSSGIGLLASSGCSP